EVQQTLQQIKIPTQGIGVGVIHAFGFEYWHASNVIGLDLFCAMAFGLHLYNNGQARRGAAPDRIVMPLK
ncbi:MAG TPA: hypothetical protein VII99_04875, partial [Bacteroidia bacterium]